MGANYHRSRPHDTGPLAQLVSAPPCQGGGHGFKSRTDRMKMVNIPEEELEILKAKNRNLARQITYLVEALARKNRDLDALHFVWCSGGCPDGVHRFSDVRLTEEMIQRAERNTKRLRSWYNTVKWRLTKYPTMSEWHAKYAKRTASKTDLLT